MDATAAERGNMAEVATEWQRLATISPLACPLHPPFRLEHLAAADGEPRGDLLEADLPSSSTGTRSAKRTSRSASSIRGPCSDRSRPDATSARRRPGRGASRRSLQAIAEAEPVRGNVAEAVSTPTLCLCKRDTRGLAARMLLVQGTSQIRGPVAIAGAGKQASCLPRLASLRCAGYRCVLGDESGSWPKPRLASRWGP